MISNIVIWLCALWLSCAPAQNGGNALEQMEGEIARIVEQVRPSVVGVSVKRTHEAGFNIQWESEDFPAPGEFHFDADSDEDEENLTVEQDRARKLQKERELREEAQALRRSSEEWSKQLRLSLKAAAPPAPSLAFASKSIGSGFAIEGGYVITTHTLAASGNEIALSLPDGKEAKGTLVGSDHVTDIALVKIEEGSLPALRLGHSGKCKPGSIGVLLSRSYGKLDNVGFGFVTGREETGNGEMLRLNFPIRPGESGSPLLNARGEVIGIASANLRKNIRVYAPTAIAGTQAMAYTLETPEPAWGMEGSREFSYFIPAERIKAVIEDLKQFGAVRRAWFGVSGMDTTIHDTEGKPQRGVLVQEVIADSSAQKAGLEAGDILLRCDSQPTPNFASLRGIIEKLSIGKPVKVLVNRDGKDLELDVIPQVRPGAENAPKARSGNLGLVLVPKSKELASYLNLADSPEGKIVSSVVKGSLAERAGIRKGDLLLDEPSAGKAVRVWRDGNTVTIEIPK